MTSAEKQTIETFRSILQRLSKENNIPINDFNLKIINRGGINTCAMNGLNQVKWYTIKETLEKCDFNFIIEMAIEGRLKSVFKKYAELFKKDSETEQKYVKFKYDGSIEALDFRIYTEDFIDCYPKAVICINNMPILRVNIEKIVST